jgi:phosphate transport system permease protein
VALSEAFSRSGAARLRQRLQHGDLVFWLVALFFALLVVTLLLIIVAVTWDGSREARDTFGIIGFMSSTDWNPVAGEFGALPAVYGTVVSSMIALVLAAPPAIMIGVFLSDLCPARLRAPLSLMVELLAAIPSVVYGMWGIFVLIPFYRRFIASPLSETVGEYIPIFAGPVAVGRGLLVAGIILAIMILPTIAAVSRDVLAVVPAHQKEAMLALGATRWEVIRHAQLPYARAGIVGGMMLGLGRALGETMAALMVICNMPRIETSLFQPATTAAAQIASQLPTTESDLHASSLILMALVLFLITLIANSIARLLVWNVSRSSGGRS